MGEIEKQHRLQPVTVQLSTKMLSLGRVATHLSALLAPCRPTVTV
jgi:hypothetical protein